MYLSGMSSDRLFPIFQRRYRSFYYLAHCLCAHPPSAHHGFSSSGSRTIPHRCSFLRKFCYVLYTLHQVGHVVLPFIRQICRNMWRLFHLVENPGKSLGDCRDGITTAVLICCFRAWSSSPIGVHSVSAFFKASFAILHASRRVSWRLNTFEIVFLQISALSSIGLGL